MKVILSDDSIFNLFRGNSKSGDECQRSSWISTYIPTVKHVGGLVMMNRECFVVIRLEC